MSMLYEIALAAGLDKIAAKPRLAHADAEIEEQHSENEATDEMPADHGEPDGTGDHPEELPADPAASPEEEPADPQQPVSVVARKARVIGGGVVKAERSFSFVTGRTRAPAASATAPKPAAKPAVKGSEPAEAMAYIARLEANGHRLDSEARTAISGYARTWSASADIRAEFGSFPVFAGFMRAKDRGAVRIFGT